MRRPTGTLRLAAALVAGACIGAGAGAATYAGLSDGGSNTVVRQVTVENSQPAASADQLSAGEIYSRTHKGVVEITATGASTQTPFGQPQSERAQGSGWVYDSSGHIVTNEHVVSEASSVSVRFWNGANYKATVVGKDPSTDLAVLKVDAPESLLEPLSLGDSSKVNVGDNVVAIGSPFGLEGTLTSGIVSALHRQMTSPNNFTINDSIQTDAAINHGNSGGPLLNAQGQVIGITTQIASDSGGSEGIGFAVPSNTVRSIASQLISNGKAEHAYLGVLVRAPRAGNGAQIAQVRRGTPAGKAGLRVGDVITRVAGKRVTSVAELQAEVDAHKPGDKIQVVYRRGGKSRTAEVTLASRPS
jgi:putative serine protease PepD